MWPRGGPSADPLQDKGCSLSMRKSLDARGAPFQTVRHHLGTKISGRPEAPRSECMVALMTEALVERVRSPVRDGDDIDRVGRVDVPVPDPHRPVLAPNLKGNLSHLVLRLIRQHIDRDARGSPCLVADLREEVTGDSLGGDRWRLPLDPAVQLLDVSEGHYPSRAFVCARNPSRVSDGAGSLASSRRMDSSR